MFLFRNQETLRRVETNDTNVVIEPNQRRTFTIHHFIHISFSFYVGSLNHKRHSKRVILDREICRYVHTSCPHVPWSHHPWSRKFRVIHYHPACVISVYMLEHFYVLTEFYLHVDIFSQKIWTSVYPINSEPGESSCQPLLSPLVSQA